MSDGKIPTFSTYNEYCIHVQSLLHDELSELAFSFAANKKGLKILDRRINEIDKQIAMLKVQP